MFSLLHQFWKPIKTKKGGTGHQIFELSAGQRISLFFKLMTTHVAIGVKKRPTKPVSVYGKMVVIRHVKSSKIFSFAQSLVQGIEANQIENIEIYLSLASKRDVQATKKPSAFKREYPALQTCPMWLRIQPTKIKSNTVSM
jgi:hypothetical protein